MKNIDYAIDEKGILTIKIDTKKSFGMSKSGKTTIIASTEGNQAIGLSSGSVINVGINVYTK